MRHLPRLVAWLLAALPLLGCATGAPVVDADRTHHTSEGFRNRYPHALKGSFWQWKLEQWRTGVPRTPEGGWHFDVAQPDVAFLRANRSVDTLTWIGHASFLLQQGGLNILIDPQLSERASPVAFAGPKRVVPPALDFADLPRIDVVLVSHNHYDHMDAPTLERLAAQPGGPPQYFAGLGLQSWFESHGMTTVHELDWWDHRVVNGVTFTFVPVQHWSKRTPWDANQTLWGGWVVESQGYRFLHAGDAGYSRDFADIRAHFGTIDLAALPIGGYAPRWFMQVNHVDPDEAVQAYRDLGARYAVGMHWGTFADLTDEPLDEPPKRLAEALRREGIAPQRFFVMQHGETRLLERGRTDGLRVRAALRATAR
jgi:L-ascorbate metabolism protein UlaG (beta-lactamase superfamily)